MFDNGFSKRVWSPGESSHRLLCLYFDWFRYLKKAIFYAKWLFFENSLYHIKSIEFLRDEKLNFFTFSKKIKMFPVRGKCQGKVQGIVKLPPFLAQSSCQLREKHSPQTSRFDFFLWNTFTLGAVARLKNGLWALRCVHENEWKIELQNGISVKLQLFRR